MILENKESKECKDCGYIKTLDNFYSQKKYSKAKGDWIYYDPVCKECRVERQIDYNIANNEEISDYKKEWYSINDGKVKSRRKERYKENPEYDRQYLSEWQKDNPDKSQGYNKERYYNKKHTISDLEWFYCRFYFDNNCAYCGMAWEEHMNPYGKDFSKEHFIDDGANNLSNCAPSCIPCNSEKRESIFDEWYNKDNYKYDEIRKLRVFTWINGDYKRFIESQ